MVYHGLDYQQEARIFANQQKYVKGLSAFEIFAANIEAGNDDQLLMLMSSEKPASIIFEKPAIFTLFAEQIQHNKSRAAAKGLCAPFIVSPLTAQPVIC